MRKLLLLPMALVVFAVVGCQEDQIRQYKVPRLAKKARDSRILGVVLPLQNKTWFFKLTGPHELVGREKPRFEAVMKTVKFDEKDGIQFDVPPAWKKFANPGMFYKAKYLVEDKDENTKSVFSISILAGKGGGVLANVNRWRGQVKLKPHANVGELAKEMQQLQVAGKAADYVDLQGPIDGND